MKIILGTLQISEENSGERAWLSMLQEAIEYFPNLMIDTSPAYGNGHAESVLGKAVLHKRSKIRLASKFSPFSRSKEAIKKELAGSLKRLRTEYLDLFQQHYPCPEQILPEILGYLTDFQKEGLIRDVGVCNWTEREFAECSNAPVAITSCQFGYSLLQRSAESTLLPYLLGKQITPFVYSPFCQGALFHNKAAEYWRSKNNRFLNNAPVIIQNKLQELALTLQTSPAILALAWVQHKIPQAQIIVGLRNSEQLATIQKADSFQFSPSTVETLDRLSESSLKEASPYETLWGFHPRKNKILGNYQ